MVSIIVYLKRWNTYETRILQRLHCELSNYFSRRNISENSAGQERGVKSLPLTIQHQITDEGWQFTVRKANRLMGQ
jgi:hypothetical protein